MRGPWLGRLVGASLVVCGGWPANAAQTLEHIPGAEIRYGEIANPNGVRQRTIVTRPAGSTAPMPTVFFVPWLSCDSVALPPGPRGGIEQLLFRIAGESGWALFRVEKPGMGGSGGVCADTDFETELAGYRAAFDAALRDPWVDRRRIVVMGQSFSGAFLPAVVGDVPVAGYVFINSWMRTWYERLIEFERLQLEQTLTDPQEVARRVRQLVQLYALILEQGKTPRQAMAERPDLAAAWTDEPERQYGRPIRFMQQLQQLVPDRIWQQVDRPTLAIWGEADIVMHRQDHERLVNLINRRRPGAAKLVTFPGMDHGMSAPTGSGARELPAGAFAEVVAFLRSLG
jgi:pimeloyl-ACP methyl ester carboxylesterase